MLSVISGGGSEENGSEVATEYTGSIEEKQVVRSGDGVQANLISEGLVSTAETVSSIILEA